MSMTRPEDHLPPGSEAHGTPDKNAAILRAAEVARLRSLRMTYAQIAEQMGFSDGSSPRLLLRQYAGSVLAENVTELRLVENEALDRDERALRTIIADPATPAALRIRAVDSRTRLSARRSRLNGLDAPIQVAVSAGLQAELDDALGELREVVLGEVTDVQDDTGETHTATESDGE